MLSEVQLKYAPNVKCICIFRLDDGFDKLNKINKKSRYFFAFITLGFDFDHYFKE